jgi:hypothetical protein
VADDSSSALYQVALELPEVNQDSWPFTSVNAVSCFNEAEGHTALSAIPNVKRCTDLGFPALYTNSQT